jgi:hypothetical protein
MLKPINLRRVMVMTFLCLAGVGLLIGALGLRILGGGLSRYRTLHMLQRAEIEWRHGEVMEASRYFVSGAWMAVEGGLRWQAAQVYLLQSDLLRQQNRLREAAAACSAANEILDLYDNAWMLDYRCEWIDTRYNYPAGSREQ